MGDSSWLNDRLSQPDYNNWFKGNLILRELKTGLVPFLDDKAKDLQQYVRINVPASSIACTVCTKKNLTKSTYICPSGICTKILKNINTQYIHHPPGLVQLMNTDNKEWCDTSRYWEIAKAYISTPGYASKRSAAETDCVGLLTIIIKCTWIQSFLAVGLAVFERIKVARNAMVHSENSIMSSGELDNLFDDCVQVLQDSLYLAADLTAQGALARIREIKDKTLTLNGIDLPSVMFIINEVKAHQEKDSEAIGHLKVWQQLAEQRMEELAKQQTKQQQDMSQLDTTVSRHHGEHQQKMSLLDAHVSHQHAENQNNISQIHARISDIEVRKSTESSHITEGSALPIEIQRMDDKAVELYKTALEEGKVDDHSIRIMIIGHFGVGKTTLARRLLGKRVRIEERVSTDGIDVKVCPCKVSLSDLTWHSLQPDEKSDTALIRLAKMIASRSTGEDIFKTTAAKTESSFRAVGGAKQIVDVQGDDMLNIRGKLETQPINKPSDDKDEDTACIKEMKALVAEMRVTGPFDPGEFASVSLWDFAGQYVFYTTHQMFLSQRAVYLLVTDISKHIDDVFMKDECYFDSSGPKQCTISEFIDFWLNSIHTCSPDDPGDESTVPPVILVGTHADKLTEATVTDDADFCQRKENGSRDKLASDYFKAVQYHLCDKPTRFHLADEDFDIDNTIIDSKLEDLKKKIVEVAKQQPHWGKPIPAKWLRLETVLCGLKEKGLKIVDFEVIEGLNLAMSVPISTPEGLELFLQFHHQSGKILYFSEGSLKEKVVLDPQWLVDALKSLITAEMFSPKNRSHVIKEWNEFHKNGILRPQLLDAVWQIETNPSFHNNRTHLLALMEKMNLISGPINTWHEDDATLTKEEYHLAPCMLKDPPSEDLLSPSQGEDCETTSILVFNFQKTFLPPAIFHRLLAACLSNWPLWQQGKNTLIFCGCGVFQIDESHKLTLVSRDFTIQAFVTKFGDKEKIPREDICIAVLGFLDKSLKSVTGCISLSSLYTLGIKCPKNKSNSVHAVISVTRLQKEKEVTCRCHDSTAHVIKSVDMLKYWFPCKSDSGTAPLTTGNIIGGYDDTDTVRTTGHKPGPTTSLAGYLKTEQDNTLAEDIHDAINLSLKSVGRLWLPNSFGTAFRVGSKYAMTNWHVIQGCVDLERCKAHINFSGDPCSSDQQIFYISSIVPYFDAQLDIAVVELKTVNPPPALPLCTEPDECKNVNKLKVLGFGHPKSEKKNEEFADVIHPGSPRVKEALALLQQNKEELKCKCRAMEKDPESFAWDYEGLDDDKNVAIDMYKEHGSSGSPAMICADATQVKVMAVVYRGLPDCFWESPDSLRPAFPTRCRIELAVKMSHIYESMKKNNLDLTKDVFQCGEEDIEL